MISWIKRIWAWLRRRQKSKEATSEISPLREFIYLDEVSVYSLRASRRGAIESTQTDSQTRALRQTIESELGASTPVAKSSVKSQFEVNSSQGTQIARKWIIQSTFKELVDSEKRNMRIRSGEAPTDSPPQIDESELRGLDQDSGVVPCSTLARGDLLELEVELKPEDIFTASQLVKSMFTFFEEMPDIFPLDPEVFDLGRRFDAVFERLLVGLVPIRARIVGQHLVSVDGEQFLVSDLFLDANPHIRDLGVESVYLVGVAERELFWRDLRRVLFSESRFLVMCRLSGDGLTTKWNPIKMTNVIEEVAPGIANEIQKLPKGFLEGFRQETTSDESPNGHAPKLATVFAMKLADMAGIKWTEADSLELDLDLYDTDNRKERIELTKAVVSRLDEQIDTKLDPVEVAQIRGEVFDGPALQDEVFLADSESESNDHLLETEIVAIYW